ncbi:c-type cytochrome [Mucilaginibacter sp. AK015]|uniref:c-type cytochrome n=1 Tax=Mucilaginibacter sp. AK015 TaxID=2723072 RepID=UPI00181B2164|nr:thiosulfate dehydrogenase [Mucilaginibacter sp. AK015]
MAKRIRYILIIALTIMVCWAAYAAFFNSHNGQGKAVRGVDTASVKVSAVAGTARRTIPADAWEAPAVNTIPPGNAGEMIRYGREVLMHTAKYFGPQGSIARISNGMNCQNCHLDGGSRLFANNYAGFISGYPKISQRSGKNQPPAQRIVDCFERSLGGTSPDTTKREVKAMLAYLKWIGQGVKKDQKLFGSATERLAFMDDAADPLKGRQVFVAKCQKCHGKNGQGTLSPDKISYTYPPLWGNHSYNDGAGMYRISNLAGFVKNNMPFGATYQNPRLTDEEAWNVAAFINSQPRPHKDQHQDWQNLHTKPIDFPFGPYADNFSEKQHKYGPFAPIKAAHKHK